ncbi:MAG: vancomycin B-type resistance protein [Bacillales bacterium]|jgi:vancomycin resistance protein VanW|nr:vancomycin B-type resistance protein [Bacillales bacterium]
MQFDQYKPKKRSKIRAISGRVFYKTKRYFDWYVTTKKYVKTFEGNKLPNQVFYHQTILLRKLRDVDMQLQHNKITNLKLAVKKINGILIKPGETFSYWKLIGNPNRRNGYVDGMVLFNGTYKTDVGGGLCQLSNLIYWMALHTPLTVTERYRHSYDVFPDSNRTQPFGSGATCAYNFLDLQIKNETNETYQLNLNVGKEYLEGEFRATTGLKITYEVYQKDHVITPTYWGGYVRSNSIYRKRFDSRGNQLDDEIVTENHAIMMYEPLLSYHKDTKDGCLY